MLIASRSWRHLFVSWPACPAEQASGGSGIAKKCLEKGIAVARRMGSLAGFAVLSLLFEALGKAVKTGHSCAAVTHHRPPPRGRRAGKANRQRPVKARGEDAPRCAMNKSKFQIPKRATAGKAASWGGELGVLYFARRARRYAESEHPTFERSRVRRGIFARGVSRKLHRKNEA